MDRFKEYDATGVAPNGKLYAGDLNLFQDLVAALSDFTQTLDVGTLRVGATDTALTYYGAGEVQWSANMRILKIIRALGGVYFGAFTTTTRDAITAGNRPPLLHIFNTTTNRLEYNAGSDATPDWQPVVPNILADGSVTTIKIADLAVTTLKLAAGAVTAAKISDTLKPSVSAAAGDEALRALGATGSTAAAGNDARLSDVRTPVDGSVTAAKVNTALKPSGTAVDATEALRALGTAAGLAAKGSHHAQHEPGGADPLDYTTIAKPDLFVNRPAASAALNGTWFYATDKCALYLCAGAAWVRVGSQAGEVYMNLTAAAHAGCLLLQGQAWPGTTGIYAELYAHLGSPAVVPDMRQYVPVGYKSGDADFGTLLATGGVKTVALSIAELPVHDHPDTINFTDAGHQHDGTTQDADQNVWQRDFLGTQALAAVTSNADNPVTTHHHYFVTNTGYANLGKSGGVGNRGGGSAHTNLQPFKVVNFEIKL